MMDLIRNYQTAIIFVLVVAGLYGGYVLFLAPSSEQALTVTTTATVGPDQDLVALLFKLKEIRLDNALFADPLFQSLKDFGKDLVVEPVGRRNPFAPFEGAPIKPAK
jgi:hypothetical protein